MTVALRTEPAVAAETAVAVAAETAVAARPGGATRRAGEVGGRIRAVVRDYIALTKPRIIVLLEVTALGAMVMAAGGWPGTARTVLTLAGGALAAGGANAINMWFDRDIDRSMRRTRSRPVPSGRVSAGAALAFGAGLGVAAFALLALTVNLLSGLLAAAALLFYVGVYTMWLKRTSIQNIVIGGAAGAVPPLVGWAAVTGRVGLLAVYLFAIVFFWTPPHFWALAMIMRDEYALVRVPMLPVVRGMEHTADAVLQYTGILTMVSLLPVLAHQLGAVYLGATLVLDGLFLGGALRLRNQPSRRAASRLFHYSLLYLALLFAAGAADRVAGIG